MTINAPLNQIKIGEIVLPAIQRDVVWSVEARIREASRLLGVEAGAPAELTPW